MRQSGQILFLPLQLRDGCEDIWIGMWWHKTRCFLLNPFKITFSDMLPFQYFSVPSFIILLVWPGGKGKVLGLWINGVDILFDFNPPFPLNSTSTTTLAWPSNLEPSDWHQGSEEIFWGNVWCDHSFCTCISKSKPQPHWELNASWGIGQRQTLQLLVSRCAWI